MKFLVWLESRQFKLPDYVSALVPQLKEKAKELTDEYYQDNKQPYVEITKIPDTWGNTITIAFLSTEEWQKKKIPNGAGIAGKISQNQKLVYYMIPMSDYTTIYHELVHAFDPKMEKGLSKSVWRDGFQMMNTPHEVDAYIAGHIDILKDKLKTATPEDIEELKTWLRNPQERDPWTMPTLLSGMMTYHLLKNRKFLSSIYNAISDK